VTGHLDLDALADLLAGEGDDAQVDHLAGCPACSAELVELEQASAQVAAALAALPAPEVPEGLAARLDAALRAERRDRPGGDPVPGLRPLPRSDGAAERPAGARVVPLDPRRRRPLLLGAAAAAAAVLVGGTALTAVLRGGTTADQLSTAAGSAQPEPAEGGRERAPQTEAPGQGGGGPGAGGRPLADDAPGRDDGPSGGGAGPGGAVPDDDPAADDPAADGPGPDYGPGTAGLAEALPGLLARAGRGTAVAGDGLERLHDPAGLAGCLSALPGPAAAPLALDYARYDGAPALVVVRPSTDAGSVEVAVVGARCRAGSPDTRLLTRLPRPS